MRTRSNEEWLRELAASGEEQTAAIEDLRAGLLRAAFYSLRQSAYHLTHLTTAEIEQLAEDCAQEALLTILKQLSEFRGDSRFTTWTYKFAVNIALTAARHQKWKQLSLDQILDGATAPPWPILVDGVEFDPDHTALRHEIWGAIREVVEQELTPRQRQVLQAIVFDEIPIDEVARLLGSNRNAVYKLLHDTRRKIKVQLEARGFGTPEIFELFGTNK
jgi:RNA polymerase sigma-70 factor (ECF subfamily)